MTTSSSMKNYGLLNFFVFSSSFNRVLSLLRCTLLASLLIGLIWLPISPAFAGNLAAEMPKMATRRLDSAAEIDRMRAFIACLPKELSKPDLKRALSEMGNDQIERALDLKVNPKISQAETKLASCLKLK